MLLAVSRLDSVRTVRPIWSCEVLVGGCRATTVVKIMKGYLTASELVDTIVDDGIYDDRYAVILVDIEIVGAQASLDRADINECRKAINESCIANVEVNVDGLPALKSEESSVPDEWFGKPL